MRAAIVRLKKMPVTGSQQERERQAVGGKVFKNAARDATAAAFKRRIEAGAARAARVRFKVAPFLRPPSLLLVARGMPREGRLGLAVEGGAGVSHHYEPAAHHTSSSRKACTPEARALKMWRGHPSSFSRLLHHDTHTHCGGGGGGVAFVPGVGGTSRKREREQLFFCTHSACVSPPRLRARARARASARKFGATCDRLALAPLSFRPACVHMMLRTLVCKHMQHIDERDDAIKRGFC